MPFRLAQLICCCLRAAVSPGSADELLPSVGLQEYTNLAATQPAKVEEITARILELRKGIVRLDYPPEDTTAACQAMLAAGGFWSPWAE